MDAFEQYGLAIIAIHKEREAAGYVDPVKEHMKGLERLQEQVVASQNLRVRADKIKRHLQSQMEVLQSEGIDPYPSVITFAYVGALAQVMSEGPVRFEEIKHIVTHCFDREEHAFFIENSWSILLQTDDFQNKVLALISTAEAECAAGHGDYLVKFMRKHHRQGLLSGPRVDLSKVKVDENWFLAV